MIWHHIIPQPRSVAPGEGVFSGRLPLPVSGVEALDAAALERLNRAAARIIGVEAPVFVAAGNPGGGGNPGAAGNPGADPDAAGYELAVTAGGIVVTAATDAGRAAALAALTAGIVRAGAHNGGARNTRTAAAGAAVELDAAVITDEARSPWRGLMLDTARHFFRIEALDSLLDVLWFFRLNRFHLHLTDDQGWRFPVPQYPRLTEVGGYRPDGTSEDGRYGGFYTQAQLRALDGDAAMMGITVVPEIDLPGHASAALTAYPELSCSGEAPGVETRWGIFHNVLCPGAADAGPFLEVVFAAVADTFGGPFIHVGGDEVPEDAWRGCPACRGEAEPYQRFVRLATELVGQLGRRPVAWDEAAGLDLPASTIILNWRRPADAAAAMKRGYDLVLAPESRAAYLDHKHLDSAEEPGRLGVCTVADSARFAPQSYVSAHLTADDATGGTILGGQANLWTEEILYFRHVEYMGIVRLAALSEGLWGGEAAERRDGFFGDLEALRRHLAGRGFAVYPGAFGE